MFLKLFVKKGERESGLADEQICKICLQSSTSSTLIHPCKCQGSIYSVHEKCLKTWIQFKDPNFILPKCELCHHRYNMSYTVGVVCTLSPKICSLEYLGFIFKLTLLLVFLLFTFYLNLVYPEGGTNNNLHMIIVITLFVISILCVSILLLSVLIKPFLRYRRKNWKILNYVPPLSKNKNFHEDQKEKPEIQGSVPVEELPNLNPDGKKNIEENEEEAENTDQLSIQNSGELFI